MAKRILIIDDDPLVTKIVSQILTRLGGFETRIINTPESAVAEALDFRPDAVLLDYRMPTMSGEEVLAELRRCEPFSNVPALLLSGDGSWDAVKSDNKTAFLAKPLTAKTLLAATRALLGEDPRPTPLAA